MRHWPDTLPTPIGPGYGLEVVDQYLRSDMEVGPARARRMTRARRDRVQAVWVMTPSEFFAFRAWFEDLPWSLAGHSDDLSGASRVGATWAGGALTPSGVVAGTLFETAVTSTHSASITMPLQSAAATLHHTVSLKAAGGLATARVALLCQDNVTRRVNINLATGALSALAGAGAEARVQDRGDGWWRVILTAPASAGATPPQAQVFALHDPSGVYAGNPARGVSIGELNVRTDAGLYLPTDSDGRARGAAGGPAWAMIPVWTGGPLSPVECRFERTFTVEVKPGLNTHVSAGLEVRHA